MVQYLFQRYLHVSLHIFKVYFVLFEKHVSYWLIVCSFKQVYLFITNYYKILIIDINLNVSDRLKHLKYKH